MTGFAPDPRALYLVLDQGSHAGRAQIYDGRGLCVAEASVACVTLRPAPDRAEHDAAALLAGLRQCLDEVARQLGAAVSRIVAAALITQRSSCLCWDRISGQALTPVLSWQDRRAQHWLQQFAGRAAWIHARTGLMLSAHYGASKLRWCLDHVASVQAAARTGTLACGPLAAFLLFHLLDEQPCCVDSGNAARTLLWNLRARDWDSELADLFGVPLSALPTCVANHYPFGTLRVGAHAVPLRLCHGDQPAALFADGPPSARQVYINVGTGAFVQWPSQDQPPAVPGMLCSLLCDDGTRQQYALEGTVNGAASALERVTHDLDLDPNDVTRRLPDWLANSSVPPLFLNGVAGLGSPFWRADFASRFVGTGSAAEQLVAVVESIVFLLQSNLLVMAAQLPAAETIIISGGLSQLDGLCQRLATLSRCRVHRPAATEASARGAAWLLAQSPDWMSAQFDEFAPGSPDGLPARYAQWCAALDRQLLGKNALFRG